MAEKFTLKIIAPDKILYEGEADYVAYPIEGGEKGVLPGHTRLIATLAAGNVRVKNNANEESYPITKGLIKINRTDCSLIVT